MSGGFRIEATYGHDAMLGPCLVTLDEIGDPYNLEMIVRVSGEERSRGNSATMYWCFEEIIAFLSRGETLYSGEVLGSGTIGNGCGLELGRYPQADDMIELEIEKIGVLPTGSGDRQEQVAIYLALARYW